MLMLLLPPPPPLLLPMKATKQPSGLTSGLLWV